MRDKDDYEALLLEAGLDDGTLDPTERPEDEGKAKRYTPSDEERAAIIEKQKNPGTDTLMEYECEGCGKKEVLTEAEAYEQGWDYPPFMGKWGVVSPRTCGNCLITSTAYWAILQGARDEESLGEKHWATVLRIGKEKEDHG